MSQYPPNPNNNPYGQNPPDPNANQGTAYGGPPSGPGQNPYNPYPNNPGTNPNPYGPYSPNQNLPTQSPTGPGSNPDYGSYNPNPPTPGPATNPNYNPYDPYGQTAASSNPNFNQYPTIPPAPPVPPPAAPIQPRRGPSLRIILIGAIALVLIIGGIIIGLASYNNTQQGYTNATATARANANATASAQANATATFNANATATANANATATANANATATALVTSQYPPFTTLAFTDPLTTGNINSGWSTATECQATSTGYQVSIARAGFLEECFNLSTTYTDFAYQVSMTIVQGDCGGLVFRAQDNQNFYTYLVCQNGQYHSILFIKNANAGSTSVATSSAIHTGLNQVNTLAVVVQGDTFNLYANGQRIDSFTDPTFIHGGIGVLASDTTAPTVVNYANAVVWTAS